MAIGLFYESTASATATTTLNNRNIHEISANISARNMVNSSDSEGEVSVVRPSATSRVSGTSSVMWRIESESENENGSEMDAPEDLIFNSSSVAPSNSNNQNSSTTSTARRLADLFRPPHGIMFNGSLELARRHAREVNRWLLVTLHAPTDFASQAMNRDLWNSPLLQSFIKENFVFVQMIVGGGEARRYENFYPFDGLYPHLALIDPRTGEKIDTLLVASIPVPGYKLVPTDRDMLEILGEFIAENPMGSLEEEKEKFNDSKEAEEKEIKKRSTSSPKLEPESENENERKLKKSSISKSVPEIFSNYEGADGIKIQFRLPNGQKHLHRFSPKVGVSDIFKTAAAICQTPIEEFKLRTAEGEVDQFDDLDVIKFHNTMLTIIK